MGVCVYLGAVMVVALGATTLGSNIPASEPAGKHNLHCDCPTVSSLLQAVGFAPACVSSSLALCSTHNGEDQLTLPLQEMRESMQEVRQAIKELKTWRARPRHCKDLLASGDSGRGVRQVYPYPGRPYDAATVFCDHIVDGGGWTVFQRRTNATTREDFYRTWVEYQLGFGNLEGEFWLGLDLLHTLTSWSLQELRVDLADFDGQQRFAKYGVFSVGPASTNYRLSIGRYSGDAGDSLGIERHNNMMFSTHEADHDTYPENCAISFRGAWWYAACHHSNLNGYQYEGHHDTFADGINWYHWRGYNYSLMNTTLMIRPAF